MIHCSDSMPLANLLKSTIILSNNNKNNKYNLNIMISSISMWFERWFLSSNAKDIGVLYLIYALFSGLVGTAFSVLIRLELSGPGVQFIADNQLYNSIITAHAIIMIFFMVEKFFILELQPLNFLYKINNNSDSSLSMSESNNNNNDNNYNENNKHENDEKKYNDKKYNYI